MTSSGNNLGGIVVAYNFGLRFKTVRGPTPYEAICKSGSKSNIALRQIQPIKSRDQTPRVNSSCSGPVGADLLAPPGPVF